ncbi:unnamed protein product [Rotaria sp. Silwood2]|nr:unnamed protein product [Rotaria sp. Silwood2]
MKTRPALAQDRAALPCDGLSYGVTVGSKRVLDTMNFDLLRGRPLRIMLSPCDPALRKSGVENIMTDENGQSKGFGFVHLETQEAADNAINKVNGMLLADKKVYVGRFMSCNQHSDAGGPCKFTNIFIKNFGDQLDEEKLRELFAKYGKITSCKVVTDESGHSKGFGFCSFETSEEAEQAVQNLNGYSIGDKQLYVGCFQNKNERLSESKHKNDLQQERMKKYQDANLYIKNLDDTFDDEHLKKEFSKFGTITSAKIMTESGRSKGFGFVCFSAPDEATKAVTEMNGSIVGSKPLYVALIQRKEERRMDSTKQHMHHMVASHVAPPIQLPFPNNMAGMMSYLPTPIGPSQPRNFYPPPALPTYRPTPCWARAAAAAAIRSQPGAQMITDMQMPQSMDAAQHRTGGMTNLSARSGMPMGARPTPTPDQMIAGGAVQPQTGVQQYTAYTCTARNLPPNNAGAFPNSIVVAGQEPLTPAALANATPQEQKQMLGERLFPLIQQMQPDLAGKITGILLEIDNTELLHMLQSPESLKAKLEEAIAVLQAHQAKQLDAAKQATTNSAAS